MEILQVKQYHREIAERQFEDAFIRFKVTGNSYPIKSMFFFMLEDRGGYPTEVRKNGYVAFNDNKAVFGKNKREVVTKYEK